MTSVPTSLAVEVDIRIVSPIKLQMKDRVCTMIQTQPPGTGHIHLLSSAQFAQLAFVYPLKLISPTPLASSPKRLRTVYLLSYGGGLISGDKVWLDVLVESEAKLLVLTQGTTKVFKKRPGVRLAIPSPSPNSTPSDLLRLSTTTQTAIVTLKPDAALYYLPSPTACFENSRYTQRQRFDLPVCGTASLIVLDWFTCGREKRGLQAVGENWDAERLEFFSEVWWGSKRGIGERIVLQDDPSLAPGPSIAKQTTYAPSLAPYKIFLSLILTGPATQNLITHLLHLQATEPKINHLAQPSAFLWSLSVLEAKNVPGMGRTVMVRACAVDGEYLKRWLFGCLKGPEGMGGLIGEDMWERAMS